MRELRRSAVAVAASVLPTSAPVIGLIHAILPGSVKGFTAFAGYRIALVAALLRLMPGA